VCETLATVVESMRGRRKLHRDYCQDTAGTNYTILRAFGLGGLIWLFRADTGELVSSIWIDDIPEFCSGEDGPTSHVRLWGALIPECTWVNYDDAKTPCTDVDEPNVHALEKCYYGSARKPEPGGPWPSESTYAPDGGLIGRSVPPVYPSAAGVDAGAR
jgi:hypothetical protein